MSTFFNAFCALVSLVLLLLWIDVEKISTVLNGPGEMAYRGWETKNVPKYLFVTWWLVFRVDHQVEAELHEGESSWGKYRGCFMLGSRNATPKPKQLWSQCLLHCALAGYFYAALNQMKCECLELQEVEKAVAIDDDELGSLLYGKYFSPHD